jgi:RNA polymerase sigma-70 factor, ECF subfamily
MTDSTLPRRAQEVALAHVGVSPSVESASTHARFHALFDEASDYVWNTLRRLGVQPCDLEDVTHDVLLDVYRKLSDYDPSRPLRPWLFAFGFRAASEYRRRTRHGRMVVDESELVDHAPLPDERLATTEQRELVDAALQTLELDQRAVLVLHELDEVAIPEIAATLGIPMNTAYSRLRLAREHFARAWKRLRSRQDRK